MIYITEYNTMSNATLQSAQQSQASTGLINETTESAAKQEDQELRLEEIKIKIAEAEEREVEIQELFQGFQREVELYMIQHPEIEELRLDSKPSNPEVANLVEKRIAYREMFYQNQKEISALYAIKLGLASDIDDLYGGGCDFETHLLSLVI